MNSKTALKLILPAGLIMIFIKMSSCSREFLDYTPQGSTGDNVLATPDGVNQLLIGAYAALTGQGQWGQSLGGGTAWATPPSNWIYGSCFGGEAQANGTSWNIVATNSFYHDKWKADYEGVSRCNNVLGIAAKAKGIKPADMDNILGQARFLRGHYYSDLKKMFNKVPWIDETTTNFKQPNDTDIWPQIVADFKYAFEKLPGKQNETGRANKWAAAAYLAKAYLYQKKYDSAKVYFDQVINTGITSGGVKYDLNEKFNDNFLPEKELNNKEVVFTVDMTANTGNGSIATANQGDMLNYPINSPFGCCGNFQPTIDLVNAYRTNAVTGLPYFDSYNDPANAVKNDMGIKASEPFTPDAGTLDPRLDWTVGRRDIPYHDWGLMPGSTWMWNQAGTGPFVNKKRIYWQATRDEYYDGNSWAPGSAINYNVISFSDVLLMAAECEAQLDHLDQAQLYVNRVRNRAANPVGFVYRYKDNSDPMAGFSNTPAANYFIKPYAAGAFASGGKDFALKAIYFERKLELAMEGHRFFDLVRWGMANTELNRMYTFLAQYTTEMVNVKFTPNNNEYYPIPQVEIDKTTIDGKRTLQQNPNY
jgi:starch-binding outer membrane protein, SusD/RagB family